MRSFTLTTLLILAFLSGKAQEEKRRLTLNVLGNVGLELFQTEYYNHVSSSGPELLLFPRFSAGLETLYNLKQNFYIGLGSEFIVLQNVPSPGYQTGYQNGAFHGYGIIQLSPQKEKMCWSSQVQVGVSNGALFYRTKPVIGLATTLDPNGRSDRVDVMFRARLQYAFYEVENGFYYDGRYSPPGSQGRRIETRFFNHSLTLDIGIILSFR